MAAIGPRLAVALLLASVARADTHDEIVDRVAAIASALSDENAAGFMAGFDKAMPDYNALRAQVSALIDQAAIESDVEFVSDTGDDKRRTAELDWYLELRSRVPDGPLVHRRQVLHCEFRKEGKRWMIVSIAPLSFFDAADFAATKQPNLMPAPLSVQLGEGTFRVTPALHIVLTGYEEPRLHSAVARTLHLLSLETGLVFANAGGPPTLKIRCDGPSAQVQSYKEDESYHLELEGDAGHLDAPNPLGVLHGLETFLQLIERAQQGWAAPAIRIDDRPRFAWRGLELDVARHWMPVDVVKRNLDGMAAVKLNVFHWHLSDDQGFRVESNVFPRLQEMGSDGQFYTQAQIRDVIVYARERGIRVIPEFDMPGHSTSWLVGYPSLATAAGPFRIERRWGVFDRSMDPMKETTYRFLDQFIGEMTRLFPDEYFHIGGDEVLHLQSQTDFTRRVQGIVAKYGKHMEGWDEILDPSLPKDTLIQSWHGPNATIVGSGTNRDSLGEARRLGFSVVQSAGYYLDLMYSASYHYAIDPMAGVPDDQHAFILGGEACMWSEYAGPDTVDSRIWPRLAAIAERFWSPRDVRDVNSMYQRLGAISRELDYRGLTHNSSVPGAPLRTLLDVVEPVKGYVRGRERGQVRPTQATPLDRIVDLARPDSMRAREFAALVDRMDRPRIQRWLQRWQRNDALLEPVLTKPEAIPLSRSLSTVAGVGLQALDYLEAGRTAPKQWVDQGHTALEAAKQPKAEVTLAIVPAVEKLVNVAGSLSAVR